MYLTALQILRNLFETSAGNKMALICLDTQILIWGIRKHAELGQEGNIPRAENLIEILTRSKDNIIIPSIVCAEACAAVPDDRIQSFMREMQRHSLSFPLMRTPRIITEQSIKRTKAIGKSSQQTAIKGQVCLRI